MQITQAGSCI